MITVYGMMVLSKVRILRIYHWNWNMNCQIIMNYEVK